MKILEYPLITTQELLEKKGPEGEGTIDFQKIFKTCAEELSKNNQFLIIAGDSFTHGDELADVDLPDFPGCFRSKIENDADFKQREKANEWYTNKGKIKLKDLNFESQQWITERQRSYPMLFQLLRPDITVINFAKGGTSIYRNSRLITDCVLFLKKMYPNAKIEAILGLSGHQRTEVHTKYGFLTYMPTVVNYTVNNTYQEFYKLYNELYYQHFSDDMLIEMYIRHIAEFIALMDVLKVKIHFTVPSLVIYWLEKNRIAYDAIVHKYKLLLEHKFDPILFVTKREQSVTYKDIKIMMPGGHYSQDVHHLMANKLLQVVHI